MSPRAAWRLERMGFGPVHDYVAGKQDWLSYGMPHEGDAELVGRHLVEAPTCLIDDQPAAVVDRHGGDGSCIVLNEATVVMGTVELADLEGSEPDATLEELMAVAVTTVRPSEQVAELDHRMTDAGADSVLVSRSDGTYLGMYRRHGDHRDPEA